MMSLVFAINTILSEAAVPPIDRNEVGRGDRLTRIAVAISRAADHATCSGDWALVDRCKPIAASPEQVAAELIAKAVFETDLRSNVHADNCAPHECDASRYVLQGKAIIIHNARSLWQLHKNGHDVGWWESIRGDSQAATDTAAWEAAKMLAGYRGLCHNGTVGAFAGFATGGKCTFRDAQKRADYAERIRWRLVALEAKEPC